MADERIENKGNIKIRVNNKDYILSSNPYSLTEYLKEILEINENLNYDDLNKVGKAIEVWIDKEFRYGAFYYDINTKQQTEINRLIFDEIEKILDARLKEMVQKRDEMYQRTRDRIARKESVKELSDKLYDDIKYELFNDKIDDKIEIEIVNCFKKTAFEIMPEYFYESRRYNGDQITEFNIDRYLHHEYKNTLYGIIYSIFKRDVANNTNHADTLINAFFSLYRLELPTEDREAHTIIIAGSGSGKSELIKTMLYRDFKNPKISTVLIDPHGLLAPQVLNMKGKDHTKIVYIKPTLSDTKTPILNPFDIHVYYCE